MLVKEQLNQGYFEPSTSPWNIPVFVIKKKSGKWKLLHDLRKINTVMESMGALQPGMPSPTMIHATRDILIVDLKDCFFTIPLHPDIIPNFYLQCSLSIMQQRRPFTDSAKIDVSTARVQVADYI